MFEQHGVIQHLNLVKDNVDPTQCRGYAFIDFADPKVAENVIQRLNGMSIESATNSVWSALLSTALTFFLCLFS